MACPRASHATPHLMTARALVVSLKVLAPGSLFAWSLGGLACDHARLETRRALLDEESSEFVILVAGPDDDHIGHRAVSDPAFLAIYNVLVALPTGLRLDHHCI